MFPTILPIGALSFIFANPGHLPSREMVVQFRVPASLQLPSGSSVVSMAIAHRSKWARVVECRAGFCRLPPARPKRTESLASVGAPHCSGLNWRWCQTLQVVGLASPDDFWTPWESVAASWTSALSVIENIVARSGPRELVWRGVVDARWALHSSLYRRLAMKLGAPPTEAQLVEMEHMILDQCQQNWRYSGVPAMTLMAQLQHFGGPTRLIDVSSNPLVALWFAIESQFDETTGVRRPEIDGRLFAFDVTGRRLDTGDSYWGSTELPWRDDFITDSDWGRGRPWHWVPPSLNERIPAQHSGFLVDGVPRFRPGENGRFRRQPGTGGQNWTIGDVPRATSVPTRLVQQTVNPHANSTPTFVVRISAASKPEIRDRLQDTMGYRASTIYPDLYGLAQNVAVDLPTRPPAAPTAGTLPGGV